ncbi:class I SAM-dependent methyltransferase [Lysobacter sp. TY2-98]|uniref:class I SAM-dependent methyltransferase n=1 Tax=Lysobacter sp. TY2-98 TaxID=2290922 RepID=UPI000E2076DD|nr:methyltransferase [Lysobacter sp. TY2-98]AXK72754.1 class I SAM-dependent methyltransferase [Lysobacter sp. TY2-98]
MHADPALDALFLPFDEGLLPPPQGAAFLGARSGPALQRWAQAGLTCEQDYRPAATALERAGFAVVADELVPPANFATVLVLPPRQREQARAVLARAMRLAGDTGRVVACAANNAGARSMQDDLAALAGDVGVLSKHKCRVAWTQPGHVDDARVDAWLTLDAPRAILDGDVESRPGLFAWDRIDVASALLAAHLPSDLAGRAADLGAGWGYLAIELLSRNPGITTLDAYEAQHRALPLLSRNLARFAPRVAVDTHWADVTAGLDARFDVIVSNPPFHADDRTDRPDLGRRFIEVAAAALNPGGRFFMVANRHLPYEATLASTFRDVRVLADAKGFKAFEARR